MKMRLVVVGLVASLAATGAVAATQQHFATASTKKEAKLLATAEARATVRTSALCFRPTYQVAECQKVEGGFRCRADSADNARLCRRSGWLRDVNGAASPTYTTWWTDPSPLHSSAAYPIAGSPTFGYPSYTPPPPGWRPAEQPVLPPLFPN